MSSNQTENIIARVKKFRPVEKLEHENVPNVVETLEKIQKFLQDHETPGNNECTHIVFDNYNDWWMGAKPSFKLSIAEDNTVETLHKYVSMLYDLQIPLTLIEKRTPEIRFVQDIEFWGNQEKAIPLEMITDIGGDGEPHCAFLDIVGKTMGEIFPTLPFLDLAVFDASGISKMKGVQKTSVRFVWSSIIVDKDRAAKIRDYMVHKFKDSKNETIVKFSEEMQKLSKENQWHSVFNDVIYFGRYGIRMPLADRVSPAPMKRPEGRPFKPHAVLRFNYNPGSLGDSEQATGSPAELTSIEKLCGGDEEGGLKGSEWLKIGAIRRETGTPLTDWKQPVWKGETTGTTRSSGGGYSSGGGGRSGGSTQVKIRTRSGSGGDGAVRSKPRDPVKEDPMVTFERSFDGTKEEFIEKMAQQFARDQIIEDENIVRWKQPGESGARIEFKVASSKVYIVGKPNQIRTLMVNIANFTTEAGGGKSQRGGTASTAGSVASQRQSEGYAPSAAYTPSAVFTPSVAFTPSTAGSQVVGGASTAEGRYEPVKRLVNKAFAPESPGTELELKVGEYVVITHDPEASHNTNSHRWVYGHNEETKAKGWFPLSYTVQIQTEELA